MRWVVISLITLTLVGVVVLALMLWRLWRQITEFGHMMGRAGARFETIVAELERASAELSNSRGVDWRESTSRGRT